jgi:tellurite methyltransferase
LNGGYEDGYSRCSCFWGRSAGSLVQRFVSDHSLATGLRVLDLGSGEGKNAFAFSSAGATVVAVDCSALGLANGQREFAGAKIEWVLSDAETYLRECEPFDVFNCDVRSVALSAIDRRDIIGQVELRRCRMEFSRQDRAPWTATMTYGRVPAKCDFNELG